MMSKTNIKHKIYDLADEWSLFNQAVKQFICLSIASFSYYLWTDPLSVVCVIGYLSLWQFGNWQTVDEVRKRIKYTEIWQAEYMICERYTGLVCTQL